MYYVNHEQIDLRLKFIPTLIAACEQLEKVWELTPSSERLLLHLAQERILHLSIETITDVGSLLIDAFMMRDASSYEDIIEILRDERVFEADTAVVFRELVQLRKSLAQEYASYPRETLHPLIGALPSALAIFEAVVPAFISRELV
ncbi:MULTISPECIES: DUF86 domain-containing protein [Paenibacillus]|jgi:uncharacterized protein YutE (UPF0331/DUF86 family)|uniref:DUF86 domain-containing protein n=1 Tax=Paenibacillus baimaensis TaxID=2982185 RepID=A0ABT2UKT7_9BACL|nr:HepT-like ribonuclease domain-containing protein [Paenibacillus sp. WQ 127069]MCU6794651.1 DUF86 domain-containing protein [Paenibacillus sp. WQ 127069]